MNVLQLALHLSAINIKIPPNNSFFVHQLLGVVQFDIIPSNLIHYFYFWRTADNTYLQEDERRLSELKIFNLDLQREQQRGSYIINNQLAFCLYDSFSLSDLLGTLFVIITYTMFFVILVFSCRFIERIIFKITGKTWKRFTKFYNYFIRTIFWNSTLRFMLESYLEVLIANGIVYNSKLTFESVHSSVESGF